MKTPLAIIALTTICTLTGIAAADISLISQERSVTAFSSHPTVTESSSDFSLFHASVTGGVQSPQPGDMWGHAGQDSTMSSTLLAFSGQTAGFHNGGRGESIYRVTFDAASTQTYSITGTVFGGGLGSGRMDVTLTGPGGVTVFTGSAFLSETINLGGTFGPGQYTLDAHMATSGLSTSVTISGDYNLRMTIVPAPAGTALLATGMLAVARRRR